MDIKWKLNKINKNNLHIYFFVCIRFDTNIFCIKIKLNELKNLLKVLKVIISFFNRVSDQFELLVSI